MSLTDQRHSAKSTVVGRTVAPFSALVRSDKLGELKDLLSGESSREGFLNWLQHPLTKAYISALHDLAYLPYETGIIQAGSEGVQLGMTMAFQTAERLMSQPETLIDVFLPEGGSSSDQRNEDPGYEDSPESVI